MDILPRPTAAWDQWMAWRDFTLTYPRHPMETTMILFHLVKCHLFAYGQYDLKYDPIRN